MLQYGSKDQRNVIISSFYSKVKRMMRHKTAADALSLAYMDYANAQQRASLVEEFYGMPLLYLCIVYVSSLCGLFTNCTDVFVSRTGICSI